MRLVDVPGGRLAVTVLMGLTLALAGLAAAARGTAADASDWLPLLLDTCNGKIACVRFLVSSTR